VVVAVNVLFPFLAFMIEDLGYSGHRLGYYAGGLAAAFCGAQFCSSILWGMISDKYGRKVAIVVGTFGTAIGMFVFGSARTYIQAIAGRALGGFLCGNIGVLKSFVTEITDDTNRGKAFSWLSVSWAIGTMIAPLLGGMLCNPTEKYPALFDKHGLFGIFPYLLPCVIAVGVNIVSASMCILFMKETRKSLINSQISSSSFEMVATTQKKNRQKKNYESLPDDDEDDDEDEDDGIDGTMESLRSFPVTSPFVIGDDDEDEDNEEGGVRHFDHDSRDDNIPLTDESSHCMLHHHPPASTKRSSLVVVKNVLNHVDGHVTHVPDIALTDSSIQESLAEITDDVDLEAEDHRDQENCNESTVEGEEDFFDGCFCHKSPSGLSDDSPKSVLRQRIVVLATGNYGMLAMAYILLDETIPLFLKLSREEGGFEFTSSQIGILLSLSGCVLLLFSSFVLPIIASKSKKWLYEVGILGALPCVFLWPILAVVNRAVLMHLSNRHVYMFTLWPLLLLTNVFKNVCAACSFTAVMIQVNHSVYEDYLGAVNGLGQSLAALARAIGPALGGMLWSMSIKNHFVFLNFIGVSVLLCCCGLLNRQLPNSIDFKKVDRRLGHGKAESHVTSPSVMMH
jgi:MFS family permease